MISSTDRRAAADLLWAAERDRAPVAPFIETWPDLDVVDAYEIQLRNIARRREHDGVTVVGHKVGLSSKAMQEMMGVDEPDYGHLLSDMALAEDTPVATERYCYPRVEVEVGFVLAEALPGEGCTEQDVLAATEALVPSIELIDSRITDWRISLPDTIADNASSAGFVIGTGRARPDELDPAGITAKLHRNGEQVAEGDTSAVLGDPTTAVAWLARKVAAFGITLEAGNLVLPGSCTRAIDVHPGDRFHAEFAGLGTVNVEFK
jgi:2-keto-4-pentenoate hydratase